MKEKFYLYWVSARNFANEGFYVYCNENEKNLLNEYLEKNSKVFAWLSTHRSEENAKAAGEKQARKDARASINGVTFTLCISFQKYKMHW